MSPKQRLIVNIFLMLKFKRRAFSQFLSSVFNKIAVKESRVCARPPLEPTLDISVLIDTYWIITNVHLISISILGQHSPHPHWALSTITLSLSIFYTVCHLNFKYWNVTRYKYAMQRVSKREERLDGWSIRSSMGDSLSLVLLREALKKKSAQKS